jgi:hypothetical protein
MRSISMVLLAISFVGFSCGIARGIDYLNPTTLKVGQKGKFMEFTGPEDKVNKVDYVGYAYKLEEVLSENEAIVKAERVNRDKTVSTMTFIVEMETKGLADGVTVKLDGIWEVVETRKIEKKTYYVLKKVKKDQKEEK